MAVERATPGEARSYFVGATDGQLPASTNPCEAPPGHYWVHAYPDRSEQKAIRTGKWLLFLGCEYVAKSWGLIRSGVQDGTLGISAKISTEWSRANDPAGPWRKHVVCVYTYDWRDAPDVLRVAAGLHTIGVVNKMTLSYKPDIFTLSGQYSGNSAGELAIYRCKPPYAELTVAQSNLDNAEAATRFEGIVSPIRPGTA